MKIILSPSKTQQLRCNLDVKLSTPRFMDKTKQLMQKINAMDKEEISSVMNIKGELLEETVSNYRRFSRLKKQAAIVSYNGLVYKGLKIEEYGEREWAYLSRHLRILSALYGMLLPFDGIKPYRLDMKMKLTGVKLYDFWTETLTKEFEKEVLIVDLASEEFSKMIKRPKLKIEFREKAGEAYIVSGTYSKQARGWMMEYMVKNKITDIDGIIAFEQEGYRFNSTISAKNQFVFTR
jgi:uncharacterized protein